jgi:hypothetical protein
VDRQHEQLGAVHLARRDPARGGHLRDVDDASCTRGDPAHPGRKGQRDAGVDEGFRLMFGNARLDQAERVSRGQLGHQGLRDTGEERTRCHHTRGVVVDERCAPVGAHVLHGQRAEAGAGVKEADR